MASEEPTRALDEAGVNYELLAHEHTESAADEAKALGVDPTDVAKTLIVTGSEGNLRAVVPASERLDLHKLAEACGVGRNALHLASEEDLRRDYPDFELGAVPPFGGPPDRVVIDRRVTERDSVVLEAGSHDESLRLASADLVRATGAEVADISED
jgi:prolyl-tRNA editing enzyme YbaK/EbsC (Cys-tRNA(Pro) deacylase)